MEKLLSAIIGATLLTLLYGSLRLWVHAVERARRGLSIIPFQPRRPVPWGLIDGLLIFVLVVVVVAGAQQLAASWLAIPLAGDAHDLTPQQFAVVMLTGSLATLASCLAALALVHVRAGATFADLGFTAAELWNDVKLGAGAFVMLAPPMYLLQIGLTQIWEYEHPVQDLLEQQADLTMLAITLLTAVGVAPFAEEMFFRVLLQGWLENVSVVARKSLGLTFRGHLIDADELQRDWHAVMMGDRSGEAFTEAFDGEAAPPVVAELVRFDFSRPIDPNNPYASPQAETAMPVAASGETPLPDRRLDKVYRPGYVPIVLSAAIFALLHLGQGPAPIPLFFLAIGLGYLYRQTHRATPSIVVHLLINSVSMAMFWFSLMYKS